VRRRPLPITTTQEYISNQADISRAVSSYLAFCEGQPDQSCLVPTVYPLRVQQVHPGLLTDYHQWHRGVNQAGCQIMGQLQVPLLDAVKTALEAATVRRRR
jgi:hypothetical protein